MRQKYLTILLAVLMSMVGARAFATGSTHLNGFVSLIDNGDMEGDDNVNFAKMENGGPVVYDIITDGVGVDGSRGVKVVSVGGQTNSWDTQFFIISNEVLYEGDVVHVSFDYRADGGGVGVTAMTQAHFYPGDYRHWDVIGTPTFTADWQTYDKIVVIDASMAGTKGMKSIAINLASNTTDGAYYFDNVVFEIEREQLGIEINEENFPDANFRNWLLQQDYGQDGKLTESEINRITSISVNSMNISSLKGIEYFTALIYLSCDVNQLTSLDVSNNTALWELSCYNTQLTSLDVSGCTALTRLSCSNNQLTSLDVSNNTAMTYLYCDNNQLTSLDVSGCTALDWLICKNNQLTSLDVSNNTALTLLDCQNNQLTSLDVSGCTALTTLYCSSNQLTSLDVSNNTAMTYLYCDNNQLTSLNVSKNTALRQLYCSNNELTSLDVSKNTALTRLDCDNNQLTSLDVSKNTALTYLFCHDNQLTILVSKNTALTYLYCWNNQLTSLDVSKNTALTSLGCYSNQIKGAAMDALISGLPQNETDNTYRLYVYYSGNDGNVCTKAQVAAAQAKGWTPYYTTNGTQWYEYEGSDEESIEINEENFPDENFRNWLLQQSYGLDGKLTEDEINGITSIDVRYSRNISSLKGIEYFTALTELRCSYNQLTSLDVSKNTALTSLSCEYNQLTSLDVSKNTALTSLSCYSNQLTSLDVSKNTALTSLVCGTNELTSLDVSKNTALTYLYCSSTQLTSLDVSNNTALTRLYCYNTQLTSLDVSKNTALTELSCDDNQLTSLDVSKNTALTDLRCSGTQLTSLDVSKNTALTDLDCYSNQIKGEAMDALISGLPQNETGQNYTLFIYYSGNDGNVCTKAQVAAAKAKGWTPYYTTDGMHWYKYEGSDEEPDGIDLISADKQGKTVIYTLDGKRMNTANAADLPKGIYIINGKKVVVK